MLLTAQLQLLTLWATVRDRTVDKLRDERGDLGWIVIIVIVVGAALTVGGIIAAKMVAEANKIPAG